MAVLAAPIRQITGAKPARRGVNYSLLVLALVGLAIARLASIYFEKQRRLQKSTFGSDGCTRDLRIMSPEDIIPVFEGVFVTSSLERRKHMMLSIGAEAAEDGGLFAIWNVDSPRQQPKIAHLALEGYPEELSFRPHGIHYRRETGELFVVNHAYSQGGERIDVFKVSEAFPQDPLPPIHASLLKSEGGVPKPESDSAGKTEVKMGIAGAVMDNTLAREEVEEHVDPTGVEDDAAPGDAIVSDAANDGDAANGGRAATEEDADPHQESESSSAAAPEEAFGENESGDSAAPESKSEENIGRQGQQACEVSESTVEPAELESTQRAGLEGDVESEAEHATYIEEAPSKAANAVVSEVASEDAEEVMETPSEKENWLKQEAQEAAAKAKAEAKKMQAKEKAAMKAAKARVSARSRGLSRGTIPVRLTYSFSVKHELIDKNYGALNDIILASDDELYVTQYMAWPEPRHGLTMPDSMMEYFQLHASMAAIALQAGVTPIIHCTGIRGPDVACERLVKGPGVMYNGIALSPNKERLLVADSVAMQLLVFSRSLETGELKLRQRLDLPGSPDNLELDVYRAARGEEAYTMGLINGDSYLQYVRFMRFAKDPTDGDHIKMAGGMTSVVFDNITGEYTNDLEMWQDGSLLSISSATSAATGTRLLGSAVSEGFLVCQPPPCTQGREGQRECPGWGPPPDSEGEG